MKKILIINMLLSVICTHIFANHVGESAKYKLNKASSRTSWLLSDGKGDATVTKAIDSPEFGPSYVVKMNYMVKAGLLGEYKGSVGLLVPEFMFNNEFYRDLEAIHTKDLGSFKIDYQGRTTAADAQENRYEQCYKVRIYDIDPDYRPIVPVSMIKPLILWHKAQGIMSKVDNIEINLKMHESAPVMGAVQVDVKGKVHGFDVKAGLDLIPK